MKRKKYIVISAVALLLIVLSVTATVVFVRHRQPTRSVTATVATTLPTTTAMTTKATTQKATQASKLQNIIFDTDILKTDDNKIILSFTGDCMLGSYCGEFTEGSLNWYTDHFPKAYFFEKVSPYFLADDYSVCNCESVFTDDETLQPVKKPGTRVFWFRGHASNGEILKTAGFELAGFENNHALDYGQKGADDTVKAIRQAGLTAGLAEEPNYVTIKGVKIGIYCTLLRNESQYKSTLKIVKEMEEQCDFTVIYFHGGKEYAQRPLDWTKKSCHNLVNAGADLIVGCHPHILQPIEQYKGKMIVYSLGNFCFGGNDAPVNQTAIYQAVLSVEQGKISGQMHHFVPCYVYQGKTNNWQPAPMPKGADAKAVENIILGKF